MPKVAILFAIIILSSVGTNSYAIPNGDMIEENFVKKNNDIFNSEILSISPDFFAPKLCAISTLFLELCKTP